jgi:hypothetical protein
MPIKYKIIPSDIIIAIPFWPSLHKLINSAYEPFRDDWPLPQPFYRLHPDLPKAAEQLVESLGEKGVMCIALLTSNTEDSKYDGTPIACGAIMEFEGDLSTSSAITAHERRSQDVEKAMELGPGAIEEVPATAPQSISPSKALSTILTWEFNMLSTSRPYQGKGVAQAIIKLLEDYALKIENGGKVHMITRTIEEISGPFWRKRGYMTLEDA